MLSNQLHAPGIVVDAEPFLHIVKRLKAFPGGRDTLDGRGQKRLIVDHLFTNWAQQAG